MEYDKFRRRAWIDPRLHTSSRRVLDILLQRAGRNGSIEISYGTLARLLGVDRPHASRCVQRLIDTGYVTRESAVDLNGTPLPNSYKLQLPE
jgi:DNA-binding MarR family transcriptional regulator